MESLENPPVIEPEVVSTQSASKAIAGTNSPHIHISFLVPVSSSTNGQITINRRLLDAGLLRKLPSSNQTASLETDDNSLFNEEELVPIRIDLTVDGSRIYDTFLWNLYGNFPGKLLPTH